MNLEVSVVHDQNAPSDRSLTSGSIFDCVRYETRMFTIILADVGEWVGRSYQKTDVSSSPRELRMGGY